MFEPAARAVATTDLEGVVAVLGFDVDRGVLVGVLCIEEEGILEGVFAGVVLVVVVVVLLLLDLEGVVLMERGVEGFFTGMEGV